MVRLLHEEEEEECARGLGLAAAKEYASGFWIALELELGSGLLPLEIVALWNFLDWDEIFNFFKQC